MQPIVTLSVNPALDKSANVDHVIAEHKLRCTAPRSEPGGGGINVARAIKQLGGEALALYTAGGPNGETLRALLDEADVTHRALPIQGWTRESFTVYETATTLQYRFNLPGRRSKKRNGGAASTSSRRSIRSHTTSWQVAAYRPAYPQIFMPKLCAWGGNWGRG